MDTLLAIASRRDERRTLPEPLPAELTCAPARRGQAVRLVAGTRQPWTFVVPTGRARIEELARAVSVPENVLGAGLVVAILVHGKGPVLFDAGRAAQSMLLAAWAEGLASCPNGITDVDLRADACSTRDEDEAPVIVLSFGLPGAAARRRAAHGRGMERAGEPQADRRGRAMAVVTRMKGGLDLGGTKIQAVVTERRVDRARQRATGDAAQGRARRRSSSSSPRRCARRSTTPASSRWGSPGSASARRARSTPSRAPSLQVANIDGLGRALPARPDARRRAGAARADRQRRQRRGRCRAPLRRRPRARLVPRRLLGHRRRRRHRDGRPAAHRAAARPARSATSARSPAAAAATAGSRAASRRTPAGGALEERARELAEGAPDGAVRADGEARARPAHERRLAARAAGGRRGRRGADPARRPGARGRDRLGGDAARRRGGRHRRRPRRAARPGLAGPDRGRRERAHLLPRAARRTGSPSSATSAARSARACSSDGCDRHRRRPRASAPRSRDGSTPTGGRSSSPIIDADAVALLAGELGRDAVPVSFSTFESPASWERAVAAASYPQGTCGCSSTARRVPRSVSCFAIEPAEWDDVMATNLRGPFLGIQAVGPHLRDRGVGSDRQHRVRLRVPRARRHRSPLRGVQGRTDRPDRAPPRRTWTP